jgi:hypothetical protein
MSALVFTGVGPSRTALAVTTVADVWVHRLNVGLYSHCV